MNIDKRPAEPDRGEYGPRGYLPERAARRARKIILRGEMGLGWPVAALVAAVLVAVAGGAFLLRSGPPGPPFAAAGAIEAVEAGGSAIVAVEGRDLIVVRAGGGVRAFVAPAADVVYCRESRLLESAAAGQWTLSGRAAGDTRESLRPVPSVVYDGVVYVNADHDAAGSPPPPDPRAGQPACF